MQGRSQRRVVQRRAFAPHVRQPHRHRRRIFGRLFGLAHQIEGPVQEKAAGVARPSDQDLPRRRVRNRPQPRHFAPLGDHAPGDEGGAEDHQHVAVVVRAGDELFGEGVDRATADDHPVDRRHRVIARDDARELIHRGAGIGRDLLVPGRVVEQRVRGDRGDRVERTDTCQRVVRDRLRGPETGGVGRLLRTPMEERHDLAALGRRLPRDRTSASVAVQQSRRDRSTATIDGAKRRHHGGDIHAFECRAPRSRGGRPCERCDATPCRHRVGTGPRPGSRRRGARGSCQHRAVTVDGERLHRRGADVDAHRDAVANLAHPNPSPI